jgi:hypothetical protein
VLAEVVAHLGDPPPDAVLELVVVLGAPSVRDAELLEHRVIGIPVKGFGLHKSKHGSRGDDLNIRDVWTTTQAGLTSRMTPSQSKMSAHSPPPPAALVVAPRLAREPGLAPAPVLGLPKPDGTKANAGAASAKQHATAAACALIVGPGGKRKGTTT